MTVGAGCQEEIIEKNMGRLATFPLTLYRIVFSKAGQPGNFTVTARADGLKSGTIRIEGK
jgi:hypothetical protein